MKRFFTVFILMFISTLAMAQATVGDKAELEKERRAIQNELKEIQGMYNQLKGQTKQSLGQLNMLNRKIALQEKYISTINTELRNIDDDIYLSNLEIYRLEKQLDTLKAQYAKTVVYAYKNRSSFDYVNFIFSANSFNDALRRVSYLRSYRTYREQQVSTINETQSLITKRQAQQVSRKTQKNDALKSQTTERVELATQRKEKDAVVRELKGQEKDLQKQITGKKKRDKDIQNAIAAIIRREIESAKKEEKRLADLRRAEEERKKAAAIAAAPKGSNEEKAAKAIETPKAVVSTPASGSFLEMNAKDVALGADFAASRGKLPWPVDRAIISVPFGRYKIEGTDLVGDNSGLTLLTPTEGSPVKAVFNGVVASIANYGEGMFLVIKHGKYYTAYSNLAGVTVSKGANISTGQVIGKVGRNLEGDGGQLDFIVMIEANNVNPATWLRK